MKTLPLVLLLAACNARDQWTISIATDAPLPQLADRLLIEILDDKGDPACTACRRQLAALGRPWPVSFGVVPPSSSSRLQVRARLFRTQLTGADGFPEGTALLDGLGWLPRAADGNTSVTLPLLVRCFGVPSDPVAHSSCDPASGASQDAPVLAEGDDLPEPGDWEPGRRKPCPADPPEGMACIPGGAFLLGGAPGLLDSSYTSLPERLIELGPFALDVDELTVGEFRALRLPTEPGARPGCTWLGPDDPRNDRLPLNCVSFDLASAICAALEKQLPTEAQWEWAAGNLDAESTWPWGESRDVCTHSVVEMSPGIESKNCRTLGSTVAGPLAGGNPLDVTEQGVRNLGGNVSEWVADAVALYSDPCWENPPADPRCDTTGSQLPTWVRSLRGASWNGPHFSAQSTARNFAPLDVEIAANGVRCAKSFR